MIPEIEIKYEEFCDQALQAVEKSIDLDTLTEIAKAPSIQQIDYEAFMQKFKNLLTNYKLSAPQGGKTQSCS
jgi:hypothetical protein